MAIQLQWYDPNFIESGFRVYRAESPFDENNLPTPLATLPKDTREYVDEMVVFGTTYYYRIAAYNASEMELSPLLTIEAVITSNVYAGDDGGYLRKYDPEGIELWNGRPRSESISGLWVDHLQITYTGYESTGYVYLNETSSEGVGERLHYPRLLTPLTDIHATYTHWAAAAYDKVYVLDRDAVTLYTHAAPNATKVHLNDDLSNFCDGNYRIMKTDKDLNTIFDVNHLTGNVETFAYHADNDTIYYLTSTQMGAMSGTDGTAIIAPIDHTKGTSSDMVVFGDRVYIVHRTPSSIGVYDLNLNYITSFNLPGICNSIDVDEGGDLYAGGRGGYVMRLTSTGSVVWEVSVPYHVNKVKQDTLQVGLIGPWKPNFLLIGDYTQVLPDVGGSIIIAPLLPRGANYIEPYTAGAPADVLISPQIEVSPNYITAY